MNAGLNSVEKRLKEIHTKEDEEKIIKKIQDLQGHLNHTEKVYNEYVKKLEDKKKEFEQV